MDVRLNQAQGSRLWLLASAIAVAALLVWASAFMIGDATAPDEQPRVGAAADFGALRASVPPVEPVPFQSLVPIQARDRGRLVWITGVAESRMAINSVWIRTPDGHRVLVRFEPAPPADALSAVRAGGTLTFEGYLTNIALAELEQILDSLDVQLPRPPPARKFGDLPNPAFAQLDSLYVKDYYVSVRPEGIEPDLDGTAQNRI